MRIKIGYMPDKKENLQDSIFFAKKHFDFIELTVFPGKEKTLTSQPTINELKNFCVLGHLHWNNNIANAIITNNFSRIFEEIDIFNQLRAKYITLHPSLPLETKNKNFLEANKKALKIIAAYSEKILVENSSEDPFCDIKNIEPILNDKIAGLTVDIGHLTKAGKDLNYVLKNSHFPIKHFHIHDVSVDDHSAFKKPEDLLKIINIIQKTKKDFSFILEIFKTSTGQDFSSINVRRQEILASVKKIKSAYE